MFGRPPQSAAFQQPIAFDPTTYSNDNASQWKQCYAESICIIYMQIAIALLIYYGCCS